ncbi:hypothetical protein [Lacticaseibacillus sharpeae]|nr:hypothetical protein [Lacticaseibacillus sharpeae]
MKKLAGILALTVALFALTGCSRAELGKTDVSYYLAPQKTAKGAVSRH